MMASARARDLIALMNRLSEIMSEEVALIRNGRAHEIVDLQAEKSDLAHAYDAATAVIAKDTQALAGLDDTLERALRDAARDFRAASRTNLAAIRAAQTLSERVLRVVASAVNEQLRPSLGYVRAGVRAPRSDGALAFACDQSA